jgi:aryl-alcohol dehydrogenase-like predicted oxidoreductase
MLQSVEASLKRLKTDRVDLLWVHMPDGVTPIDEIARGLDDLVRSGLGENGVHTKAETKALEDILSPQAFTDLSIRVGDIFP